MKIGDTVKHINTGDCIYTILKIHGNIATLKNPKELHTFMAKWKGHYGAVKVKSVNEDKAIVEIRFADPYLNYEKEANTKDLELYPEHICIPDSFNGHCPVCGRYCR